MFETDNRASIWQNVAYKNKLAVDERDEIIAGLRKHLAAKNRDLLVHEENAAVYEARIAGKDALINAYGRQHPDSPIRRDSGKRFRDGSMKLHGQIIFEAAFDAKLKSIKPGLNPRDHRVN